LQHSKTPWKNVAKAINKLDNEGIWSSFIETLEALFQEDKHSSEEFYSKLADLIIKNASL
jgi:hypothetical protein